MPGGSRGVGLLSGLAASAIWGGMYVVSKVVLEVIPPFSLISLRLVMGAAALAVPLVILHRPWPKAGIVWRIGAVGLVGYGISLGLQFLGTKWTTAANAALVTSASPAFLFLFGAWILGERLHLARGAALALALAGVTAVIGPSALETGSEHLAGNLALLGASVSWGLYSALIRAVSRDTPTLSVSFLAFLGGLPLCLPLAGMELASQGWPVISRPVAAGVIYLGLISTALAMYLWNRSLAILEAGVVSLLFFAQPVVGIGLGAWLLGERAGAGFWIGAAMILAGLLFGIRREPMAPGRTAEAKDEC